MLASRQKYNFHINCCLQKTAAASAGQASESEEDDIIGQPNLEAAGDQLPQSSDKTTEVLDSALKDINPR